MSKKVYTKNTQPFCAYLNHINQKSVLVDSIKKKLTPLIAQRESFVFTDIGGGEGSVALAVIDFLRDKVDLEAVYLDSSEELSKMFEKKNNYKKTSIVVDSVENVDLPRSDFILVAHVLKYVDNQGEVIDNIVGSLSSNGIVLVVDTNNKSDDVRLRNTLGLPVIGQQIGRLVVDRLVAEDIPFEHEVVESHIDFSDILRLNDDGRALLSFFYHEDFKNIPSDNIKEFQQALKTISPSGKITKREDYIWIYAS